MESNTAELSASPRSSHSTGAPITVTGAVYLRRMVTSWPGPYRPSARDDVNWETSGGLERNELRYFEGSSPFDYWITFS